MIKTKRSFKHRCLLQVECVLVQDAKKISRKLVTMPFTRNLCEEVWAPFSLSVTTAAISLILCLLTVPGNILICVVILKDPYKELRGPFNYLLLNLAISDIVIGVITEPLFVLYHVREAMEYPVSQSIWAVHLSFFVSCTASLLSLSALTMERYLTVTSFSRRTLSINKVLRISFIIWLVALTIPFIYFVTDFYLFAFIFGNTAVVITFCIVTFTYARVYQRLRAQIVRWATLRQNQVERNAIMLERKLTRVFLMILFVFLGCIVPSCVMIYVINLCDSCDCAVIHWLRDLQFLLTLLNCSMNQFLYAWRMPNFCRALSAITRCRRHEHQVFSLKMSNLNQEVRPKAHCHFNEDVTMGIDGEGLGTNHVLHLSHAC